MVSAIGIMLGFYIVFRVMSVAMEVDSEGRSILDKIILTVFGAISLLAAAVVVAVLIASDGSDLHTLFSQLNLTPGSSLD